jgi:hypothetical protein
MTTIICKDCIHYNKNKACSKIKDIPIEEFVAILVNLNRYIDDNLRSEIAKEAMYIGNCLDKSCDSNVFCFSTFMMIYETYVARDRPIVTINTNTRELNIDIGLESMLNSYNSKLTEVDKNRCWKRVNKLRNKIAKKIVPSFSCRFGENSQGIKNSDTVLIRDTKREIDI